MYFIEIEMKWYSEYSCVGRKYSERRGKTRTAHLVNSTASIVVETHEGDSSREKWRQRRIRPVSFTV